MHCIYESPDRWKYESVCVEGWGGVVGVLCCVVIKVSVVGVSQVVVLSQI